MKRVLFSRDDRRPQGSGPGRVPRQQESPQAACKALGGFQRGSGGDYHSRGRRSSPLGADEVIPLALEVRGTSGAIEHGVTVPWNAPLSTYADPDE